MVAPTGPDGKVRHVKGISEKLVPLKKGLQVGLFFFLEFFLFLSPDNVLYRRSSRHCLGPTRGFVRSRGTG